MFAFAFGITPGPNNVMLTASGANFGFRRTLPHITGIVLGFPLMVLAVGLGLGEFFAAFPQVHGVLRVVGVAYLLWLSWKIATAGGGADAETKTKPLNFLQAAGFQWVNPKAWIIAIGAIATFTSVQGDVLQQAMMITAVMVAVAIPCAATWAAFGTGIGRLLKSHRARTLFNWSMAALLVASVLPLALK